MRNPYSKGRVCDSCGTLVANQNIRGYCRKCYLKKYRLAHAAEYSIRDKNRYKNNRDKLLSASKERQKRRVKQITEHSKNRYKNDINFRLRKKLSTRLWHALHKNYKKGKTLELLGCSIEELKKYLESKFQPGMTWDNYGKNGWHIDHIVPISSFDLSDLKQQ